jgi:hypothetical protein
MNRAGKLYRRLDELEAELRKLIIRELERFAEGHQSTAEARRNSYLVKRAFPLVINWRATEESEWMLKADREIVALRTKLGEPLPGPCLEIVEAYARDLRRRVRAQGPRASRSAALSTDKQAAREALRKLRAAEEHA